MALGGVGEAALLGAAMGGGAAALTGGDPLKGALLGGLTGGVGGGISSGLSALAPEAAALTSAGTAGGSALGASLAPTASSFSALGSSAAPSLASVSGGVSSAGAGAGLGSGIGSGISALPSASALGSSFAPSYALGSGAAPSLASVSGGVSGSLPNAVTAAAPQTFTQGMAKFASDPMASIMNNKFTAGAAGLAGVMGTKPDPYSPEEYDGPLKRFRFNPETYRAAPFAEGGIANLASGGYDQMVGEQPMYPSNMAHGGIADLGTYSDGGRMLRGPGDGMSDSIPGVIGGKRPARLADGEFVVPADVVSHLGNGSTDAGAKHLYSMMDKVRTARTGNKKQGREINPRKYVPA